MSEPSTVLDQVYGYHVPSRMEREVLKDALSTMVLSFSFCDACLCKFSAIQSAILSQNTSTMCTALMMDV